MKGSLILLIVVASLQVQAQKKVYIPKEFSTDSALKTWSVERSYQSANFVVFWGPVVGADPLNYSNKKLSFDPVAVTQTLEKIYDKYINELHFCSDGPNTNLGRYKIIIVMNETWPKGGPSGWAFGGAYNDTIGAMWVHPNATRDGAALSHELMHSLQAQNAIQENKVGGGFNFDNSGFFWEGHANFMRTQIYPELAATDMPRWLATGMYHWSSTRHHYINYDLLYTIQQQDGMQLINRLWHESLPKEHPLVTLKRLKGWNQNQLDDFIYSYAKREVTADYTINGVGSVIRAERRRLKAREPHYLWRQYTLLQKVGNLPGRYVVPGLLAPQDYGFNIIPLYTNCAAKLIQVKFKGHAEVDTTAGWRYGFVAVKKDDSTARYSEMYSAGEKEISFQLMADEEQVFLVVVGAPTAPTSYPWEAGYPKIKRFPYELTIANALPEGYQPGFRAADKINGHVHKNGGGWVSNTASVDASVFVGANALVLGTSAITGNVKIDGNARVEDAVIKDNVSITGNVNIWKGRYSDNVIIKDNAILNMCTVTGNVIAGGNCIEWGVTLSGSVVIGGDAEAGNCSTAGVYLQCPHPNNGREDCDGKGKDDTSNIDINKPYQRFSDKQMKLSKIVHCK